MWTVFQRGKPRSGSARHSAAHYVSSLLDELCSVFLVVSVLCLRLGHYHWSVFHLRGVLVSSYITVWDTLASGLQIMITSELSRSWSMLELLPSTAASAPRISRRYSLPRAQLQTSFNILYLLIPLKTTSQVSFIFPPVFWSHDTW